MHHPSIGQSRHCRPVSLVLVVIASAMPIGAAEPSDATAKDHAIFVGAALAIDSGDFSGNITNVVNNDAEVTGDGTRHRISLRAQSDLKVKRAPTMSTTSVTIANQKGIRMYSPANNPALKAAQNQMMMANLQADKLDAAKMEVIRADVAGASLPRMGPGGVNPAGERAAAATNFSGVLAATSNDLYNPGVHAANAQEEAGKELFDMYQITFDLSSPEVIEDAYVAMLTTVLLPDTPGRTGLAITMRELGTITPTPRRIRLADGGLPAGFTVEKCEVHVYVQGQEIASNNSERLVRVTRAEAFQFLLIQYLMAHRGQDTPVTVALEMIPMDFGEHVSTADRGATVNVRVNQDGEVETALVDPALDASKASYIESVVRKARFFPALVKGEPTTGDATLTLSELAR